jgi:acetyl-CoA C-acetyltransferase
VTNRSGGIDGRAPCIVGVGQVVTHSTDPLETEPLELWAEAAALAWADAQVGPAAFGVDELAVVRCDSWSYDAPARRLVERLKLSPSRVMDSDLGGHQPQALFHAMCDGIVERRLELGLVVSGESLQTVAVATRAGETPPWRHPASSPPPIDLGAFFHESEVRHGMLPIMRSFSLRDSARRARLGADLDPYAAEPASTYAAMSAVAASNPYAWHRTAMSPEEILRIDAANRMPVRPYPKRMMASPNVNQAAALLVASHDRADELGVPADRRVYVRGWASASDHPYVAANEDLGRSVAMGQAAQRALRGAGLDADELGHFDLYSCFPSSVRFAADALGVRLDDGRGMTVTGGMPYAGAPGSGYVTQALAAMAETLRREDTGSGLVSGLSAQMATHAFSVLSARPGAGEPRAFGEGAPVPTGEPAVPIRAEGRGPATVEAYAVACDRDGANELAVVVCRLPDQSRCYAQSLEPELLDLLSRSEGVGRRVELTSGEGGTTQIVG